MRSIDQNPFRVLGISITGGDKDIAKQISDMSIYTDMGKTIEYDSDNFLPIKPTRTSDSIVEAKQKIDQPENKLFNALFWFWEGSGNTVDDMAFDQLINNNLEKAVSFWKSETNKGINSKNLSNYKNLSTLFLGFSFVSNGTDKKKGKLNKEYLSQSLALYGDFFSDGYFDDFSKKVLGNIHAVNLLDVRDRFLDEILSFTKSHISKRKSTYKLTMKELLQHFESFPTGIQEDVINKLIGKNINNIEKQIKSAEQKIINDESKANKAGFELYKNTQTDLKNIQSVLSKTDLKYQLIADKIADELIDCSIKYFNKYRDTSTDPSDDTLKLFNYAKEIAVGDKIKEKLSNNGPTIKEYVNDKPKRKKLKPVKAEFDFIYKKIRVLQSETQVTEYTNIAKRFIESCKPKLDTIKNKLGKADDEFLEISDIVANNTMGLCFQLMNVAMKVAEEKFRYDDYSKASVLKNYILPIEPVFDLVGKLEMSNSTRKLYTDFCNNVGFTPRRPYRPRSSSSSSPSTYTPSSSGSSEDNAWVGWVFGIIIFLVLIANC